MRRRDFIAALGGVSVLPLSALAQQHASPVVGLVSLASADAFADNMDVFHKSLGEAGYVEARNVLIEYHWLEGHHDGVTALAPSIGFIVGSHQPMRCRYTPDGLSG
jgi:putative tryptophan/tyrosine transport system substrate-binding protein